MTDEQPGGRGSHGPRIGIAGHGKPWPCAPRGEAVRFRRRRPRAAGLVDAASPRAHDFVNTPGFAQALVWTTAPGPTLPFDGADPTPDAPSLVPDPGATSFDRPRPSRRMRCTPTAGSTERPPPRRPPSTPPGIAETLEPDSPGMHTTPTIDYNVVLAGEVWRRAVRWSRGQARRRRRRGAARRSSCLAQQVGPAGDDRRDPDRRPAGRLARGIVGYGDVRRVAEATCLVAVDDFASGRNSDIGTNLRLAPPSGMPMIETNSGMRRSGARAPATSPRGRTR